MNDYRIKENLYDLYSSYSQHKALFEFYQKFKNIKNEQEIRERIEYLKKHKVRQRTELETLLWILNEVESNEIDY